MVNKWHMNRHTLAFEIMFLFAINKRCKNLQYDKIRHSSKTGILDGVPH